MADLAVMNAGGISVPIFTTYSSNDYEYILNDCKPSLIIVSNNDQYKKIKNHININEQKIILANEATSILHGSNEAAEAEKIARNSFSGNTTGENLPNTKIDISHIGNDVVNLVSIIDKNLSKSEIRRLIKSNGVKINNQIISDDKFIISNELIKKNNFIKLSIGKKKHYKIVI